MWAHSDCRLRDMPQLRPVGMPRTQCASSANFCVLADTRTLVLAPFHKFFRSIPVFFWLPMHFGCGKFESSYIFTHFQAFLPIFHPLPPRTMWTLRRQGLCSHIDLSQPWGPREGKGYVAILISPNHGDPEKARVM